MKKSLCCEQLPTRKIPREILDKVEEDVQKTKFADLVDTKEILIFNNFSDKYSAVKLILEKTSRKELR